MFWHLSARTLLGTKPFTSPDVAWWFWRRMREAFPNAAAACLMPNHPHILVEGDPRELQRRLRCLMSGSARHVGAEKLWERAPEPTPVRTAQHLERQVKYVVLNPCRAGLTPDPLAWPWTTYRGLLRAEVEPWVSASALAPLIHRPIDAFEAAFHEYICNDSSVSPVARGLPRSAPPGVAATPLSLIGRAATSVTPWSSKRVRRDVIVALARHQGWRHSDVLAAAFGCSKRSINRARPIDVRALRAATLALGTSSLRVRDAHISPPIRRRATHPHEMAPSSDTFGT